MNHNIKAVVAIAPSAYVFWGIRGPGGKNQITSSWSYRGKDIPFAPVVSSDEKIIKAMKTHKFLQLYSEATRSPKAIKARIRVEKAKAPILFVSGRRDELWPSYNMAQSMIKRLKETKYPYYYKHLTYNVGHNVIHEVPESWNEILSFLKVNYPSSAKMTRKAN
jgi:pimeloyl-ACP methyl ester carboxylesterase